MFGFSFGEVIVLVVVVIIMVGPRQMPSMLRSAGQWLTKMRRMAFDMRSQSGIDQLLRDEGLESDIKELRQLLALRKGNMLEALAAEAVLDDPPEAKQRAKHGARRGAGSVSRDDTVTMLSEYPAQGCDVYGAVAEDVAPYMQAYEDVSNVGEPAETASTKGGSSEEDRGA